MEIDLERIGENAWHLPQSLAVAQKTGGILDRHFADMMRQIFTDLAASGFVVVRREDLERAIDWYDLVHREWQAESNDLEACDRLRAALTTVQEEED